MAVQPWQSADQETLGDWDADSDGWDAEDVLTIPTPGQSGSIVDLAGTISSTSDVAAAVRASRSFGAVVAGQSVATVPLRLARLMSGAIAAQCTVNGVLRTSRRFSGSVSAVSSISTPVRVTRRLGGVVSCQSDSSCALRATRRFQATVPGTSSTSGGLRSSRRFSAAAAATSSVSAQPRTIRRLGGALTGTTVVSAPGIRCIRRFSGTVPATTSAFATLAVGTQHPLLLAGMASAAGSLSATLAVRRRFSAACASVSYVAPASLTVQSSPSDGDTWTCVCRVVSRSGLPLIITFRKRA